MRSIGRVRGGRGGKAALTRSELDAAASEPVAVGYSPQVLAALQDLPPEQRAVVVLRYVLEYTPGEIARALELPRGTVNSRLRRGLDALEKRLCGDRAVNVRTGTAPVARRLTSLGCRPARGRWSARLTAPARGGERRRAALEAGARARVDRRGSRRLC